MNLLPTSPNWRPVAGLVLSLSTAAVEAEPINFNIPVQGLGESIKRFAQQTGLTVAVDSALIAGRTAPAVQGNLEPEAALKQLLAGSGLTVSVQGNHALISKQSGDTHLKEVAVVGQQPLDGSPEAGYRVDKITAVGPFTNLKLQDAPYSMTILSKDFLDNTQAYATPGGFADKLPSYQHSYTDQRPITGVGNFRGISGTAQQLIEGLPLLTTSNILFLEPYERVEAMSSVSGFMYGIGGSGGKFNYVLKRPTARPVNNITLGFPNGTSFYGHAELGGMRQDGRLGYRFNIAGQDGDTRVDDQSVRKFLVSTAVDYQISDWALLQLDGAYSNYHQNQLPPTWNPANGDSNIHHPSAPDSTKNWGQPWTYADTSTGSVGANLKLDLSKNITSRSSLRYIDTPYDSIYISNSIQPNGTYTELALELKNYDRSQWGGYQLFDIKFNTFSISHTLTIGFSGYGYQEEDAKDYVKTGLLPGVFSLSTPRYVSNPNFVVGTQATYVPTEISLHNWIAGDQIEFNKQWSAIVGAAYSSIEQNGYNTDGAMTSHYEAGAATPTAALTFKPMDWLTTYVSYGEGLQQGLLVSGAQFTNNGAVLPPYLRQQTELGAKATLGNTLLSLALFNIDSALQYSVNNGNGTFTYKQDGQQQNQGIETTITGELMPGFRVLGGFTFLDATVTKNASNPAYVGKRAVGVAEQLVKLTAEYDLPPVRGLTLTGGAYYTSDIYADQLNLDRIDGHTTYDAGLRYTVPLAKHPITFRLNASNITDNRYWLGAFTLGDSLRISGSAQINF
ncbi:TonB-dependent siderophore receptor [Methylobacter sp.]